jgi:hypothetical protein
VATPVVWAHGYAGSIPASPTYVRAPGATRPPKPRTRVRLLPGMRSGLCRRLQLCLASRETGSVTRQVHRFIHCSFHVRGRRSRRTTCFPPKQDEFDSRRPLQLDSAFELILSVRPEADASLRSSTSHVRLMAERLSGSTRRTSELVNAAVLQTATCRVRSPGPAPSNCTGMVSLPRLIPTEWRFDSSRLHHPNGSETRGARGPVGSRCGPRGLAFESSRFRRVESGR